MKFCGKGTNIILYGNGGIHRTVTFLHITSIQLFHHQSYGHPFPVPNEPAKPKVHQIPSHPAIMYRAVSFFSLLQCSMVSPSSFTSCHVCCHVKTANSCPVCCDIIATIYYFLPFSTRKSSNIHPANATIHGNWNPFKFLKTFFKFHSPADSNRIYFGVYIIFC